MSARLLLLAMLLALPLMGAQRPAMEEQLRRMVPLPKVPYELGLQFDPETGFTLFSEFDPTEIVREALKDKTGRAQKDPIEALKLARAYALVGDNLRSQQLVRKARELAESQLPTASSGSASQLARALYYSGETEEVDFLLRRLLGSENLSSQALCEIGTLQLDRALDILAQERAFFGKPPFRSRLIRLAYRQPDYETRERAQRALNEAEASFKRALKLSPDESETVLRHALFQISRAMMDRALARENEPGAVFPAAVLPRDVERELTRLLTLQAKDSRDIAVAAFLLAAASLQGAVITEVSGDFRPGGCWAEMSDSARERARLVLHKVEQLRTSSEPRIAAGAAEHAALIQGLLLGNLAAAEEAARAAVKLDAKKPAAWRLLLACAEYQGNFSRLNEHATWWLKQQPNALAWCARAKAAAELGDVQAALLQLQAALRADQNNPLCNFFYAAVSLREPGGAWRARDPLSKAERGIGAGVDLGELRLLQGIHQALSGNRTQARGTLRALQNNPKHRERAAAILEVIGV